MMHPLRHWALRSLLGIPLVVFNPSVAGSSEDREPPRLAVAVIVSGLSPGQIERVDDLFVGGLRRMLTEGAVLTNCHHDHAMTYTGPGHFALMSGRHPGPVGIIENSWYDPTLDRVVDCVEDPVSVIPGTERTAGSYRNVAASTVGDWLKQELPRAKVFSFSGKDRSAILMAGRAADGVYWYDDETGRFVTSTYYQLAPHPWVEAHQDARGPLTYHDRVWERVLADTLTYERRARADDFEGEIDISSLGLGDEGRNRPVFDHHLPRGDDPSTRTYREAFRFFPFIDVVTLELAQEAIRVESLGGKGGTDLVCVGLSAMDSVGHEAGPYSQEAIDVLLRIDRELGEFLEFLDDEIGHEAYVVMLSSDHGFMPLPEYAPYLDMPGSRAREAGRAFAEEIEAAGRKLGNGRSPFKRVSPDEIYLDHEAMSAMGVSEEEVESMIRNRAAREDWVARVMSKRELLAPGVPRDALERRFRNNVHPSRSPDIFICAKPGVLLHVGDRGTTHGSPYPYDTYVPAMFLGTGVKTGEVSGFTRTIDLAPTLAALLWLSNLPDLDGNVIGEVLAPTD